MGTNSLFINAPTHLTVATGEVIYRDGDEGSHMYGIVSGAVELRKGQALIDHLPRNVTAVAVAETVLADIDRKTFLFLVHESPTFALGIMGALASRLRDYDEWFGMTKRGGS